MARVLTFLVKIVISKFLNKWDGSYYLNSLKEFWNLEFWNAQFNYTLLCGILHHPLLWSFSLQDEYILHFCDSCEDTRPLPRPFLGTSITLQHSETWHGNKLPLVTHSFNGRLGNCMGQYASMYALSKMYNATVLLYEANKKYLQRNFFPNISLSSIRMTSELQITTD